MRKLVMVALALGLTSQYAGASKKCGNSYIADNKVCHIGTSAPYVPPAPTPVQPYVSPLTLYGNCQEARKAGWANVSSSSPNYRPEFDRDRDGVACESGGDDDMPGITVTTPAQPASMPVPAARSWACPTNTLNEGREGNEIQARPVRTFEVQGHVYVLAREFACANGLDFQNDVGILIFTSPTRRVTIVGKAKNANGRASTMAANLLTLEDDVAVYYAELLDVFGLTVKGQKLNHIPTVPLTGQHP